MWIVVVLAQNLIHEGVHYGAAVLAGEPVAEFRLFTNGLGTSQVVFATPVEQRTGAHWLLIVWLPALVTLLIGYIIYAGRRRLVRPGRPLLNVTAWYAGIIFMLLDPLYYGLLSVFVPGSDVDAARIVGWSPWPVRVVALAVLAVNLTLVLRWAGELRIRRRQP